jgi:hypothetical protein
MQYLFYTAAMVARTRLNVMLYYIVSLIFILWRPHKFAKPRKTRDDCTLLYNGESYFSGYEVGQRTIFGEQSYNEEN